MAVSISALSEQKKPTFMRARKLQGSKDSHGISGSLLLPPKSEWGPQFWSVMRTAAIGMGPSPPLDLQNEIKRFYESLMWVLPCPECREHYAFLWDQYPIENYLESNQKLLDWVFIIQNNVTEFIKQQELKKQQPGSSHIPDSSSTIPYTKSQTPSHSQFLLQSQQPVPVVIPSKDQNLNSWVSKSLEVKPKVALYQAHRSRGTEGTPAAYTNAVNTRHSAALERLKQSAKYYKRGCSC